MSDYKAVRSTVEISRRIACYLDMFDPQYFNGMSQARAVRNINDILQGRSEWTVETLLGELRQKGPALAVKAEQISQEIQDFQAQRELLKKPYKRFSDIEYDYKMHDDGSPYPLKMIDQRLYDQAAQDGFQPRFFRESYFDNVTFYCLPDVADLYRSEFHGCTFAVCRINGADFQSARIYNSTFHSCRIQNVFFATSPLRILILVTAILLSSYLMNHV